MLENRKSVGSLQDLYAFTEEHPMEQIIVPRESFDIDYDGCDLRINCWGQPYLVNEAARDTILSRYGLSGRTLRECTDSELSNVINSVKRFLPENVSVMIMDNMVIGVCSENYAHIPLMDILNATVEAVSPFYEKEVDAVAEYDYSKCYVKFTTEKEFEFCNKKKPLVITLTNSESGESSVRFGAYIGSMIPIMSDITVIHAGEADIEKVQNAISGLESVVRQAYHAVKLLDDIHVVTPVTAVKKLGKNIGIPEKYCKEITDKIMYTTEQVTAADIYSLFAETINDAVLSQSCKEQYRNNLLKLVTADWSDFSTK